MICKKGNKIRKKAIAILPLCRKLRQQGITDKEAIKCWLKEGTTPAEYYNK